MSRISAVLYHPNRIVDEIVAWAEQTCDICREDLAHVRKLYPQSEMLWTCLCEQHFPLARVYADRDDAHGQGYLTWLRAELARFQVMHENANRALQYQERIDNGMAWIERESPTGDRLIAALQRIEKLQNCKPSDYGEMDRDALQYHVTCYAERVAHLEGLLARATQPRPMTEAQPVTA